MWLVPVLVALALRTAHAAEDRSDTAPDKESLARDAEAIAYKLTPTYMHTSNQPAAWDLNLRGNLGAHTAWIGYYRQPGVFQQARAGYEYTFDLPLGHLVTSLQSATGGFLGGSLTAEVGERFFGILGYGRTNLKEYYNLNFDPNDAVTFGLGTRALADTQITLFQVRGNRVAGGQHVTHLVGRAKPDAKTRWTLDLFYKSGPADDGEIVHGIGLGVTFDYGPYFARVTSDPYVNFTPYHMTRIALGLRF